MRTALRAVVAIAVIGLVVGAVWLLLGRDAGAPSVAGLRPNARSPFDEEGALVPGPSRALYSRDGARVAVIHAGRVDLAVEGRLRPITSPGGNVVDAAWFTDGATMLLAEGPIPTGSLAVVSVDGVVRGAVGLDRAGLGFGTGHGMSVAPDNRRAALTAVTRRPLQREERHIVEVDLVTGAVRDLTLPGDEDEFAPRYLASGALVYSTPARKIAGVVFGRDVIHVRAGRLETATGDALGTLPEGAEVVDVAPAGDRAIVVVDDGSGQPRLREVRLTTPRSR